jgi:hypothetical protein
MHTTAPPLSTTTAPIRWPWITGWVCSLLTSYFVGSVQFTSMNLTNAPRCLWTRIIGAIGLPLLLLAWAALSRRFTRSELILMSLLTTFGACSAYPAVLDLWRGPETAQITIVAQQLVSAPSRGRAAGGSASTYQSTLSNGAVLRHSDRVAEGTLVGTTQRVHYLRHTGALLWVEGVSWRPKHSNPTALWWGFGLFAAASCALPQLRRHAQRRTAGREAATHYERILLSDGTCLTLILLPAFTWILGMKMLVSE